jgi:Ni/Fe-hydrogenase subunit HybB-like protein
MTTDVQMMSKAHDRGEEALAQEHLMHDPRSQEEMNGMVMEAMQDMGVKYYALVAFLAVMTGVLLFGAWGLLIFKGYGLAGMNRPVYWGLFITNFVFWIGISHAGTFVSAILRVFKAEYRRPFTRAAEMLTTFGLMTAGIFPILHLGRSWRFYWMIPYPNQRMLWPNFRAPIMWDMIAITTYLLCSTMYLYLPLIPDLAMTRDHSTGWKRTIYKYLALGWRGTERQWAHLQRAINIFAFAIIPVMFSVHTIVAWDFAATRMVGWHTTIFGPFFVIGAILSGVSAVAMVLIIVRATMKNMKYFIRPEHFDAIGKLILIVSMGWAYFFYNEFFLEWYGGEATGHVVLDFLMSSPIWWIMIICNMGIPFMTLWSKKVRRTPWMLFTVTALINVGMYFERVVIINWIPFRNRMPFDWGDYMPSPIEISITLGALCLFALLYVVMSRLIPLIPVWEVKEGQTSHSVRKVGKASISSVAELE